MKFKTNGNRLLAYRLALSTILLAAIFPPPRAIACTSILVTRGASVDGSVLITYACDDAGMYGKLQFIPAADHKAGDTIAIAPEHTGDKRPAGKIAQVPHTFKVVGWMNEHQLAIGETTFGGRHELKNPSGLISYPLLMQLALERCRTAREAIHAMAKIVDEYGYNDTGESFSIGDTQEAWLMEMVPTGPGGKGAIWAAVRVPDGQVCCHANTARIGEVVHNDPDNCLYSENVESYAVQHGWYDPKSGKPFSFRDAYCPATPISKRTCDTRVWSVLRRVAPSKHLSPDYHRGKPGAEPYPLWLPPDAKLAATDVMSLMRDHYEGTEYDMTQGIDAGPYGLPRRWRPLTWKVDGVEYAWERPIATQQSAYTYVSQSRAWLPNAVGGLTWFGLDDAYTSCYMPIYCGIDAAPKCLLEGTNEKFSWDSAWWIFNLVANTTYTKYSQIMPEVRACQKDIEWNFFAMQGPVEKTAAELAASSPNLMTRFLTDYSCMHAKQTVGRWKELAEHLLTKYNDGYVRDINGKYPDVGYPEAWLRRVVRERPEQFKLPADKPVEKH
jgi:dipeptidase